MITYRVVATVATATASATLEEVARRVVVDYLGVAPDERFVLVTDSGTAAEIADAVLSAAFALGADATHVRIAQRARSGEEPPPAAAAAMAEADVCLCVAARSLYHTRAKGAAQAAGTRGCFNAPARLDAWTAGAMTADFSAIRRTAERLAARLRGAERVRVTAPSGTDVTVAVGGREPRGWYSGIVRRPGEISAFPGGEVSFPPLEGTASGTIVFEHVMTDLGPLDEPITVRVADGLAVDFAGGASADRLRRLVAGVPGATNIAELGIGLNGAARLGDDITEAKKRLGTAHFALGDNAGGYGGVVDCPLHLDGMVLDATISIDGEDVVRDGALLL